MPRRPPRREIRAAVWGAVWILLALHVWPIERESDALLLGFVPWDLAYHVIWMVAAAAAVLGITELVWPDPSGDSEGDAP